MKRKTHLIALICVALCAAVGVSFAAKAIFTYPDGVEDNTVATGTATLSSINGTSFAVSDLIPYDQPADAAGSRIISKQYSVTVGDDAVSVSLKAENFAGDLSGKLYYRISDQALSAPSDTAGWTALADGTLAGAENITESGTYFINIILVTSELSDGGKTATFDVVLTVQNAAEEA